MVRKKVRHLTRLGYHKLAKPILFANTPDRVHEGMIRMARGVQRIPFVRDVPKIWAYKNDKYLAQELHGIIFKNPVGLSAGLDKNADTVGVMRAVGFGWMTAGSVTAVPCTGNPRPWFHRLKKTRSLVVYTGLFNRGSEQVAKRISRYPAKLFINFPLSVSAAKTNNLEVVSETEGIKDYCVTLARMEREPNVRMHEINISCPNTYSGEPFIIPERLKKLLQATDDLKLDKPVFVKMPISLKWQEFKLLLDVIIEHNIQGVSIGNLLKDRTKAKLLDDLPDTVKGNLSGAPCREISTSLIRETYEKYGDRLTIIGIGGVFTPQDAYEKIKAGASLVALVTGVIFEGPQLIGEINRGLVDLLREDGFSNISEAIGQDIKSV
ncbi:quinone-dependent dihydroorotate dehydrogenase [Candidatus Saccharibacteria bacterium]|nr:quinone-dependent dihydroorotate dehydrogenase [Candidatus Saccharibacteria bacterium]NCU40266.1 quinone-dependent dihydroorotate dehydrogenase [Candidatus Saccharibacteria bacterium]